MAATLGEDLTVISASACARRFLATPLDEIILRRLTATALAKAKGNLVFFKICFPGPTRDGWGNRFAMDAKTSIKKRLPSRHVTEG
ncbi:MAG TPA: hypothetical protein VN926_14735, partial [Bradyrhizobium sp.]|nr:hypothetical protein [Bradyrhizobium sp.]